MYEVRRYLHGLVVLILGAGGDTRVLVHSTWAGETPEGQGTTWGSNGTRTASHGLATSCKLKFPPLLRNEKHGYDTCLFIFIVSTVSICTQVECSPGGLLWYGLSEVWRRLDAD
jgi:hypothetical protein